jgi:hypothetical protein
MRAWDFGKSPPYRFAPSFRERSPVDDVQEGLFDILLEISAETDGEHTIRGKVKWSFNLQWVPGGEVFYPDQRAVANPWWYPTTSEASFWDDSKYVLQGMKPIDELFEQPCFLPFDALMPFNGSDPGFPSAWWCWKCGMINQQIFMRHRECSHCKVSSWQREIAIPTTFIAA